MCLKNGVGVVQRDLLLQLPYLGDDRVSGGRHHLFLLFAVEDEAPAEVRGDNLSEVICNKYRAVSLQEDGKSHRSDRGAPWCQG